MDEVSGKSSGRPPSQVRGEPDELELSPDEGKASGTLLDLLTSRLSAAAERTSMNERAKLIEVAQRACPAQ